MSVQNLQATHIPIVAYQPNKARPQELLPDWLRSSYINLANLPIRFQLHTVTETDVGMPDYAAFMYYGDEYWYWLIADFNGIINPITDYTVGSVIKIPDLNQCLLYMQTAPGAARESKIGEFVQI